MAFQPSSTVTTLCYEVDAFRRFYHNQIASTSHFSSNVISALSIIAHFSYEAPSFRI